uniref:Uncharacterized protein n=1 Tax=Arundo donax TaxID=35708 RepID=A0A0A9DX71_ARUDO
MQCIMWIKSTHQITYICKLLANDQLGMGFRLGQLFCSVDGGWKLVHSVKSVILL